MQTYVDYAHVCRLRASARSLIALQVLPVLHQVLPRRHIAARGALFLPPFLGSTLATPTLVRGRSRASTNPHLFVEIGFYRRQQEKSAAMSQRV